jgi:hypothetical protein
MRWLHPSGSSTDLNQLHERSPRAPDLFDEKRRP